MCGALHVLIMPTDHDLAACGGPAEGAVVALLCLQVVFLDDAGMPVGTAAEVVVLRTSGAPALRHHHHHQLLLLLLLLARHRRLRNQLQHRDRLISPSDPTRVARSR